MKPRISVIIPTYNNALVLNEVLRSLSWQTLKPPQLEVIVVDNGSKDETPEVCKTRPWIKYISCARKSEWEAGRARNVGAEVATADHLLFLDSDVALHPAATAIHVIRHNKEQRQVVLGNIAGAVHDYETSHESWVSNISGRVNWKLLNSIPDPRTTEVDQQNGYFWFDLWSGHFSISRDLFFEAGGFDERFTVWGHEDLEFGYRLKELGARFHFESSALSLHFPTKRDYDFRRGNENLRTALQMHKDKEWELLLHFGAWQLKKLTPWLRWLEQSSSTIPMVDNLIQQLDIPLQSAVILGPTSDKTLDQIGWVLDPTLTRSTTKRWALFGLETSFYRNMKTLIITDIWKTLPQSVYHRIIQNNMLVVDTIYLADTRNYIPSLEGLIDDQVEVQKIKGNIEVSEELTSINGVHFIRHNVRNQ